MPMAIGNSRARRVSSNSDASPGAHSTPQPISTTNASDRTETTLEYPYGSSTNMNEIHSISRVERGQFKKASFSDWNVGAS
jgi:hypothetical protein